MLARCSASELARAPGAEESARRPPGDRTEIPWRRTWLRGEAAQRGDSARRQTVVGVVLAGRVVIGPALIQRAATVPVPIRDPNA